MLEVELLDDDSEPRAWSDQLLKVNWNNILPFKCLFVHHMNNTQTVFIFEWKKKQVREQIINQSNGSSYMMVKYHMDDMVNIGFTHAFSWSFQSIARMYQLILWICHLQKRVSRLKRQYYWTAIPHSPFTLVVTYPEPYGLNRVQIRYEDEIHRIHAKGNDVLSFFEGHRWRVHPDW